MQLTENDSRLTPYRFPLTLPCTNEILAGLGQMYTADERFAKDLDCFGAGTAAFLSTAIALYTH